MNNTSIYTLVELFTQLRATISLNISNNALIKGTFISKNDDFSINNNMEHITGMILFNLLFLSAYAILNLILKSFYKIGLLQTNVI